MRRVSSLAPIMMIYRLHKLLIKTLIFHLIRTGMANARQTPHSALNEEDLGADIPPAGPFLQLVAPLIYYHALAIPSSI